jgi:hypothetical protein
VKSELDPSAIMNPGAVLPTAASDQKS